jgi:hypothetical protein
MTTLRSVFRNVRAFRDLPPDELPNSIANIVFFASDEPMVFSIPGDAAFENDVCAHTLRSFTAWEVLKEDRVAPIITDDRNPLGRLQLAVAEDHFAFMRRLMPVDVWLH